MTMLKHQRDDTVHEGERDGDFSIKACVTCHAVNGADGQPVGYSDPKHFCRSCHAYASVSIDCFECHESKPAPQAKAAERRRRLRTTGISPRSTPICARRGHDAG